MLGSQFEGFPVNFVSVLAVPKDPAARYLKAFGGFRVFEKHPLRLELGVNFGNRHRLIHRHSSGVLLFLDDISSPQSLWVLPCDVQPLLPNREGLARAV